MLGGAAASPSRGAVGGVRAVARRLAEALAAVLLAIQSVGYPVVGQFADPTTEVWDFRRALTGKPGSRSASRGSAAAEALAEAIIATAHTTASKRVVATICRART